MFGLQLRELGALAVGVVVRGGVVGGLELGDGGFNGEGAVVVEGEGAAGGGGGGEEGGA